MEGYRESLLKGSAKVAVWGLGHIGYSTLCHFAEEGVNGIGVDIDEERVKRVNRGEVPIFAMDYWLGFAPGYLFEQGAARATTEWRELISAEVLVHFVAIPTERDGKPYLEILGDVCRKISKIKGLDMERPPLVVIESTLTPNTTDEFVIPIFEEEGLVVGEDILLGCSPRRDWFATPDRSLRTLHRVGGATNAETGEVLLDVLGIVCENMVPAPDHLHAEVVKSIENAYRHMEIALANELSLAYSHLDMRTVLQLVGTKWNVGTYQPSFGIGGYCIPLSSHYVLDGATHPERLGLLRRTVESSEAQPGRVVEYLVNGANAKRVGILGLSYAKNMRVPDQSPTLKMIPLLRERGIEVKVNDPHFTDAEIKEIAGVEAFAFPQGLSAFDTVLVVAGHREYNAVNHATLLDNLEHCRLLMDNTGIWEDVDFEGHGIGYHLAGSPYWLGGAPDLGRSLSSEHGSEPAGGGSDERGKAIGSKAVV